MLHRHVRGNAEGNVAPLVWRILRAQSVPERTPKSCCLEHMLGGSTVLPEAGRADGPEAQEGREKGTTERRQEGRERRKEGKRKEEEGRTFSSLLNVPQAQPRRRQALHADLHSADMLIVCFLTYSIHSDEALVYRRAFVHASQTPAWPPIVAEAAKPSRRAPGPGRGTMRYRGVAWISRLLWREDRMGIHLARAPFTDSECLYHLYPSTMKKILQGKKITSQRRKEACRNSNPSIRNIFRALRVRFL